MMIAIAYNVWLYQFIPRNIIFTAYPSVTKGFSGVGNPESNLLSGSITTARQGYLNLHMGLDKIHLLQILQPQFLGHLGSSSFQMDLEF
jgi:hypothetical protein